MTDDEFVVIYIDRKISFIEETEKAYTAIIDSIPPFYEMIYDDKNFAEKNSQHSILNLCVGFIVQMCQKFV
jgi:hypothetical protein